MRDNTPNNEHPVVRALSGELSVRRLGTAGELGERAVLELGRPFTGVVRPKGYRRGTPGQCFRKAWRLAYDRRGTYVEGFALTKSGLLDHHAWITLDGFNALDVTWPDPRGSFYFGIPFSLTVLGKWSVRKKHFGFLNLPDKPFDELLQDLRPSPLHWPHCEGSSV